MRVKAATQESHKSERKHATEAESNERHEERRVGDVPMRRVCGCRFGAQGVARLRLQSPPYLLLDTFLCVHGKGKDRDGVCERETRAYCSDALNGRTIECICSSASKIFPRPHPPASAQPLRLRVPSRKIRQPSDVEMTSYTKFRSEIRRGRQRAGRRRSTEYGRCPLAKREKGRKPPLQIQSNSQKSRNSQKGRRGAAVRFWALSVRE